MLATFPQRLPGRSRACGFWISWFAGPEVSVLIDTAQAPKELTRFNPAGDRVPPDSLLVVISPEGQAEIQEKVEDLSIPVSGPFIAALIIDELCIARPGLAERIGWSTIH